MFTHVKTNNIYVIDSFSVGNSNGVSYYSLTYYRANLHSDGSVTKEISLPFTRPTYEFFDGRFVLL